MNDKFKRQGFSSNGDCLYYNNQFVARFKRKGLVSKTQLKSVLCKYYSPDEYFARIAKMEYALQILRNDGVLVIDVQNSCAYLDGKRL